MTVKDLETALQATGYPFAHYAWSSAPKDDYGVFAEENGADLGGDNTHIERGTEGTIDLFTRDDTTAPRDAVEAALNGLRIPWRLNSIQYEDSTGFIHYEWEWAIYG